MPPTRMIVVLATVTFAAVGPAQGSEEKWSYEGANGPAHWADLDPAFAACAAGHEQSPVALEESARHHLGEPSLSYHPSKVTLTKEHGTVVASVEPGSELLLDGKHYALLQFHFHHPSEHSLDGKHYPVEMHFVHKAQDGSLAVFGVFIAQGEKNVAIAPILDSLSTDDSVPGNVAKAVDLRALVGGANIGEVFRYSGSLTTPPCTEGVSWSIREKAITWSSRQITQLTAAIPNDERPLQPLNKRAVFLEP